ncbi:MAG: hypothetical protein QF464_04385 [Myxococcota bacterium]|nr:hypothetical protein [Myxococcota bacterium]
MGRLFRRFGLVITFAIVTTHLSACGGCNGNSALLTQKIDAPETLEPEALETPGAAVDDPTPGAGVPCVTVADCDDGNPCTEADCVEEICAFVALPTDMCCDATPLQANDFDDPNASELDADAPFGGASWTLTEARAVSAPNSLYFGNSETLTLGAAQRVIGALRLPPVALPAETEAHLTLRLFVDIESDPHRDQLQLFADILDPSGATVAVIPLMTKADIPMEAYAGFALVDLSLASLAGETLRLRLDFDSVQPPNPNAEGVFVDDLEISTLCPDGVSNGELPTAEDSPGAGLSGEEDDPESDGTDGETTIDPEGDETTTDPNGDETTNPAEGEGEDEPVPGGSLVSGGPAAEHANPCDAPDAHEGCCTSDEECDDGNPATVNVCEGAECVAGINPDACTADPDCDDGEPCTLDTCVDSLCVHEGTFGTMCCTAGSQPLADFDNESLQGLFVTDNLETGVFWRTDPTRTTSGDFALYCGEPIAQTYGIGERVKSSATTPVLELPAGGHTRLVFDLFMLTRPSPNVDVFQVFVLRDGVLVPAWSSKVLTGGNTVGFSNVEVDLASFAGQSIQLRFVFDSVDGHAPDAEGTYIDSMRLETTCL